ncbi:hypothetical protein [Pseudonocardia endophytica]|nr:hypothetical protein [Pseudonocardia endophytica]
MVLAISFLEAPLKFRAPGVTVRLGLGIGRIVFRALNAVELVFAVVTVAVLAWAPAGAPTVLVVATLAVVAVQLGLVRPVLHRRSDLVLSGEGEPPRSRAHLVYIGFEVAKVVLLAAAGVTTLVATA